MDKVLRALGIIQGIALIVVPVLFIIGRFVLQDIYLVHIGLMLLGVAVILRFIREWLERKKQVDEKVKNGIMRAQKDDGMLSKVEPPSADDEETENK